MSDLIKFDNPKYTIAGGGQAMALRVNDIGKVLYLSIPEAERLIAELDASINKLAQEAKVNG